MAKRKEVGKMHCVEFGFNKLSNRKNQCLHDKFVYKYKLQRDYVRFINNKILKICEENEEMKKAWDVLENSRKNNGIYVNKNDEDDSIYHARKVIWNGIKEYKLLQNDCLREFRQTIPQEYFLYLEDCFISNTLKEKTDAYERVYAKGYGYKVSVTPEDNIRSLTSRPEFSGDNHYTRAISLYENNGNYYIRFRDTSPECIAEYRNQSAQNAKRHTYKKMDIRVPFNLDDELQCQIKSNEFRGAIRLIRTFKRTKWRYGIQISYYTQSPVIRDIIPGKHKLAINIQTETRAIVRDDGYQEIIEFAPNSPRVIDEICQLDIYMDKLRRINNPGLFLEDGQIRYNKHEMRALGLEWKYSRRYIEARNKRRELFRRLTNARKTSNLTSAKLDVCSDVSEIILDNNQFTAWKTKMCRMSAKSKKIYDNGIRKKDYTKQIADRAPASYQARVEHLCEETGITCNVISRFSTSTYNHFTQENDIFTELNKRLILMNPDILQYEYNDKVVPFIDTISVISDTNGNKYVIQRDLYAAAKMLFCKPTTEKRLGKDGKEYSVTVDKIDNVAFSKFFTEVFYPKHLDYLKSLIKVKHLGVDINNLIFGN